MNGDELSERKGGGSLEEKSEGMCFREQAEEGGQACDRTRDTRLEREREERRQVTCQAGW